MTDMSDMKERAFLLTKPLVPDCSMATWSNATKRVGILLDDAVEHIEEALESKSHLNVIRDFMYSTNAMAQYLRWLWIMGELTGLKPLGKADRPELWDCIRVIGHMNGTSDIMGVFNEVAPWTRALEQVRDCLPVELGDYNTEALTAMQSQLGDIVRIPTIKEAQYAPDQVPVVNTRALYLDDSTVYYADGEKLRGRPLGELALIAGGRLNRMHTQVVEQMTDATDADWVFAVARLRLQQNSLIVRAFYDMKLMDKGDSNENIGLPATGSECASATGQRRTA